MEAPVPASALIHSATLVSAGIFLILRFNAIFELSIYAYFILPLIGSITAFYGGLVASYQTDIKRILAYSTISHCGFLVVFCSLFTQEYTILYLYVHGFFKAASFLCVGNIIRFSLNCQDIRYMGGYYKYLPFECCALFICFLNLAGVPFTLGYLIKHMIVASLDLNVYYISYFIYINILGGAITGLFYCSKIFYNVFFDYKRARKSVYMNYMFLKTIDRSNNLYSTFSVTTLASTMSIFLLIVAAYIICVYMLINTCSLNLLYSEISGNLLTSNYFNFFLLSSSELFNFGYFNTFTIFVFIFLTNSVFKNITQM